MRPLPYTGHTWSFTQHAVGLSAGTLYGLLKCAAPFEGLSEDYGQEITNLMVAEGILTQNFRDGRPDAWRDYQQILAEIGLIYSTRSSRRLLITEAGHMFLAGEIGFSELIGAQAFRYQYPNGQKFTIQSRLREALSAGNTTIPNTLIELQVNAGLLIKPGTLVIRILIELEILGERASLSASECQAFLMPCRKNSEWHVALSELRNWRTSMFNIDQVNRHSRRNIQDWFKFLANTDFCEINNSGEIILSAYSLHNIELVKNICSEQESADSFWIPIGFDNIYRQQWFEWFGHITFKAQSVLRTQDFTEEYIHRNYIGGTEDEDDNENAITSKLSPEILLSNIDLVRLERDRDFVFNSGSDLNSLVEKLRRGAQKRHAKTLLHDRIVKELAEKFQTQGAIVSEDPDSVDILAQWPSGEEAIFEVKTVTRRSFQERIRRAIGQVEEYAYRRSLTEHKVSDRIIVVNIELEKEAWQTSFLVDYLKIGLICKPPTSYSAFAPTNALSKSYWIS